MTDDFPFDPALRFGEADDELHPPGPEHSWTETAFWSFHVPERSMGGWLYVAVRPNEGTVAGGAFVYDATAWLPWEALYYVFLHHQPLLAPLDLRDATLPTGVSIKCLEPGMRYAVGYRLPGRDRFTADLEFTGVIPPIPHVSGEPPFSAASHYDQHGRIQGTITLDGETIPVDCIAVRDRSWGPRPDVRERDLQIGYCFAASSAAEGFLAFTMPRPDQPADTEHLFGGYLFRDGRVRRLRELTRANVLDPETGGVSQVSVEGEDEDGRRLQAAGTVRSRTVLYLGTEMAMISSLQWQMGEGSAWGEDQSVYPNTVCRSRRLGGRR